MAIIASFIDRWLGRASGFYTFWPLVPPTLVAGVSAYLSTGVVWIAGLGAWGFFTSGLVAFFLTSVGLALIARTKLWRIEAATRARIGGDSSSFDPMARVYENKRLYLRDLAPLGRKEVLNKKFVNCEIIGPGTVVLGIRSSVDKPWPELKNSGTFDVDAVEISPDARSHLAIAFIDCDFDSCKFYHMTALFQERLNETLSWITKPPAPPLLEDRSDETRPE